MSFDNRINNFEALIAHIEIIPEYNPNESDSKVTALEALLVDLKAKNQKVIDTNGPLNDARKNLDKTMYIEPSGLIPIAIKVKEYVKSIY